MKRRHGINTSHTKHLTSNQQLQQSTEQTQLSNSTEQTSQIQQQSAAEDPLAIPQTESTTVQVNINFLFAKCCLFHCISVLNGSKFSNCSLTTTVIVIIAQLFYYYIYYIYYYI